MTSEEEEKTIKRAIRSFSGRWQPLITELTSFRKYAAKLYKLPETKYRQLRKLVDCIMITSSNLTNSVAPLLVTLETSLKENGHGSERTQRKSNKKRRGRKSESH